jgi:hypothetical protein
MLEVIEGVFIYQAYVSFPWLKQCWFIFIMGVGPILILPL